MWVDVVVSSIAVAAADDCLWFDWSDADQVVVDWAALAQALREPKERACHQTPTIRLPKLADAHQSLDRTNRDGCHETL